jgi:hypothetical protein
MGIPGGLSRRQKPPQPPAAPGVEAGHEEPSSRREHPAELSKRLLGSIGEVQPVEGHHHVKGVGLKGKIRGIGDRNGPAADGSTADWKHILRSAQTNNVAASHGERVREALIYAGGQHQGSGSGTAGEALPKRCELRFF